MYCKNCGKELPEESSFCPYCMTKFTEEIPAEPISKQKSKQKILIAVIAAVTAIALVISSIFLFPGLINKDTDSETSTNKSFKENVSAKDDTEPGLASIKPYNTNIKSDNEKKLLLDFFDTDYFSVKYNSLKTNTKIYKNSQIYFYGFVKEILSENNGITTALVEYSAGTGFDGIHVSSGNYVIINCDDEKAENLNGNTYWFYGNFTGLENYTISSENLSLPAFNINRIADFVYDYVETPLFSENEIQKISQYFFGKESTVRTAENNDFEFLGDDYYDPASEFYYITEISNKTNKGFSKYALYSGSGGYLIDCKTDHGTTRYITFSADFEHFYVRTSDTLKNLFTFECYDKYFKKIWSRQFDGDLGSMDYTTNHIYLSVGEMLYIIDAKTGNNSVEPKHVGQKIALRKLTDGILLLAEENPDSIMKVDLEGNKLWTISTAYTVFTPAIQLINGNYVLQFISYSDNSAWNDEITVTTVVSPKGSIVSSVQEN